MEGQADTEGDFESLLRRVKAHPDNFHYLKRLLQTMREKEIRRPDVVIAYAPNLLRKKSKLGDEGTSIIDKTARFLTHLKRGQSESSS